MVRVSRSLAISLLICLLANCGEDGRKHTQATGGSPSVGDTAGAVGSDGEGTAVITSPRSIVAGAPVRVVVTFTVGASGLPVGGGVSLGLHHASLWPGIQISAPSRAGFVTARGPRDDSVQLEWHPGGPPGMFVDQTPGLKSDFIFHQVLIAKVINRKLRAGDTITFTLGANERRITAPTSSDSDNEFRITTDVDGDGSYRGIAKSPRIAIVAARAHHLAANIPAQIQLGAPFDILIRAEDEFYNVAADFHGAVTITDERGVTLAAAIALADGMAKTRVSVTSTGPHRLRLTANNGALKGRSNPTRSFRELPALKLYWGDIHGHTGVSDGLGDSAREFFQFGRDVAGLDVVALTDHGHFDWAANIDAVQEFYVPHEYVTVLAQEAGAGQDHMNLYFRRDDTDHISKWQDDYQELLLWVYDQYNSDDEAEAMMGPHHFTYDRGDDRYPFGIWDARTVRFVEIYSSHGASEYPGNPRSLPGAIRRADKYMQAGLARGLRFGVIGASDNHDSKPGRSIWGHYPGGLAGFWAEALTRESIWNAMWNYRVYATSLDRIYLEFDINGNTMGSDFTSRAPVTLRAYVIGKTDTVTLAVLRDNQEIHTESTDSGVIEMSIVDQPASGEHFYYLRVTQDNDERAWSTPIWVTIQ